MQSMEIWFHWFVCLFMNFYLSFIWPFIYLESLYSMSIHLFIHWFTCPYICLFIDSSVHAFVYSLIHLSIHLFIHWYTCLLFQPLLDPLLYHVIKLYKIMKTNLYSFFFFFKCMFFKFSYVSLRSVYKPFAK